MFPNYFGLICAAVATGGFAGVYRRVCVRSRALRWSGFAVASVLSVPAVYQVVYYLHWLPEAVWFYEARSWRGAEMMVIPVGAAGGFLAALLPRRMLVLPLLGVVGMACGPFFETDFCAAGRQFY